MAFTNSAELTTLANGYLSVPSSDGTVRRIVGTVTTGGAEAVNDTLRFFRVRSRWHFVGIRINWNDISGTGDMTLGLHDIDGGAAVDSNCFIVTLDNSAIGQSPALLANNWLTDPAIPANVQTTSLAMWQIAGMVSDPVTSWDVSSTIITQPVTIADDVFVEMLYVDPGA